MELKRLNQEKTTFWDNVWLLILDLISLAPRYLAALYLHDDNGCWWWQKYPRGVYYETSKETSKKRRNFSLENFFNKKNEGEREAWKTFRHFGIFYFSFSFNFLYIHK